MGHCPNHLINNYFEIHTGSDASDTLDLREVTQSEASHYNHIFQQPTLQDRIIFKRNKQSHVHVILYDLCDQVDKFPSGKANLKL